jgi:ligand-binding sensor domain-containing protein
MKTLTSTSSVFIAYGDFEKLETGNLQQTKMNKVEISSLGRKAFLSAGYGVYIMEKAGAIANYTEGNSSLSNNSPKAAAWDNAGNLWIGTNFGIDVLSTDGTWSHIDTKNSNLYNDRITAIAIDSNDNVWAANWTDNNMVHKLEVLVEQIVAKILLLK